MSKSKEKQKKINDNLGRVENALNSTEQFLAKNSKVIIIVIAALILIVFGYMAYDTYYKKPREASASNEMYYPQNYFANDSIKLALNGDGMNLGFLDIINKYGSTKTGNLACYYVGICYMKLGEYQNAVKYLDKFSSRDLILAPMAEGMKGDAYMYMNDNANALKYYLKAANDKQNDFISPVYLQKAAWVCEIQGNWNDAAKYYKEIKTKYPMSDQARDIEKFITHAKAMAEKK